MTKQDKELIQYLLLQYMEGKSSESERNKLSIFLDKETDNGPWEDILEELFEVEPAMDNYNPDEFEPIIRELIRKNRKRTIPPWTRRVAVAATIIGFIGVGFFLINRKNEKPGTESTQTKSDIQAPSGVRATITLAGGQMVFLDSTQNGTLAVQGTTDIIKSAGGEITYRSGAISKETVYNTLTNPRGSRVVSLTLSDGTRVWLNAESSISYPTVFNGTERKLKMTGEAYFEVVHNAKQPFRVDVNGTTIEDIGTAFNINAYKDEPETRTTVISGSVKVNTKQQSILLQPNQAAILKNGELLKAKNVDAQTSIAWKNDLFTFEDLDIRTILRQVSRWYNVDLEYKTEPGNKPLSGGLSRQLTLQQVLNLLQGTGTHFELKDKKLIISK